MTDKIPNLHMVPKRSIDCKGLVLRDCDGVVLPARIFHFLFGAETQGDGRVFHDIELLIELTHMGKIELGSPGRVWNSDTQTQYCEFWPQKIDFDLVGRTTAIHGRCFTI